MTTVKGDVRQRGAEVTRLFCALGGEYNGRSDYDGDQNDQEER